jgi:dipeptidyl aminopeptidase/acylaminoacyl peptidase
MPDYAGSSIVGEIRLARPDGSDDHALTPGAGFFEHQATWAPDGSSIVFRGTDATGREGIWAVAASGAKLTRAISNDVTDTFPGRPVVSATSPAMLAWPGFNGEIWTAHADGTAPHAFTTGLVKVDSGPDKPSPVSYADLDWLSRSSPGQSRLALVVLDGSSADPSEDLPAGVLYTVDVTGSKPARIAGSDGLAVAQARWSPDGSRVALTIRHGATTVIEVASSTLGTGTGPAVSIQQATAHEVAGGSGASANARDPAWSPDGSKLAFASDATGTFEIYTIDAAGGTPTQVTHTEASRASCAPSWGSTKTEVAGPPTAPSDGALLPLARGWLPGGTYTTDRFDPAFKVTLPVGWQVWQSDVDDVWLRDFTDTAFLDLDIGRITVSYPQGCYGTPTELAPKTAHDLIAWLQKRQKLKVTQLKTTQVGGAPAIQVDVTGVSPGTCEPPSRILLFDVANGSLFVRPGETIRLIAVDVRGTLVVVVPRAGALDGNGMSDPKLIDTLVRPIIDTMEFVGGS